MDLPTRTSNTAPPHLWQTEHSPPFSRNNSLGCSLSNESERGSLGPARLGCEVPEKQLVSPTVDRTGRNLRPRCSLATAWAGKIRRSFLNKTNLTGKGPASFGREVRGTPSHFRPPRVSHLIQCLVFHLILFGFGLFGFGGWDLRLVFGVWCL
jgi:hypothetical protein